MGVPFTAVGGGIRLGQTAGLFSVLAWLAGSQLLSLNAKATWAACHPMSQSFSDLSVHQNHLKSLVKGTLLALHTLGSLIKQVWVGTLEVHSLQIPGGADAANAKGPHFGNTV